MTPRRKLFAIISAFLAAGVIFVSGLSLGFRAGELRPQNITIEGVSGINGDSQNTDFSVFWQAWDIISKNYLNDKNINTQNKVYGAISGLVQSLGDPHSQFFDPPDNKRFTEDIQGNFGGIGAEIGMKKDRIVVVSPLKNSPAEKVGLKAEDVILAVNSTSTEGLAVDQAVAMIRGPKGSEVKLTVFREGWDKPKEISIIRDTIVTPTIDASVREGNIAYVQLHRFNANANQLFYEAMVDVLNKGARGMVFDLRNNPGGYLDVAVDLSGWFVPRGTVVVSQSSRNGVTGELRASGNAALKDFPIVVLTNGGSASASEILAGALRDLRGVKLIGETTFGKGTVQEIMDLKDGSSLKLTIAHWVLPSGRILDHDGLVPDIEVKPSEKDIESGNDVQLTKAFEVMREMLKTSH